LIDSGFPVVCLSQRDLDTAAKVRRGVC